jgi:hypothetical protein
MTTIWMRSARCVVTLCALLLPPAATTAQTAPTPQVAAANAFLATLDEKQRQRVLYSFNDEQQRQRWSNFPVPMVPRGGISLKEMTPTQRAATMALLSSMLSAPGYAKVQQIMEADEVNKVNEEKHPTRPRGAGGPPPPGAMGPPPGGPPPGAPGAFGPPRNGASLKPDDLFGKDLYFISILGKPSETTPWMLQFGGHHLALNITVAGARGVLTPTLTGAQPAIYTMNGKTVRPLAQESDQAIALLNTLDKQQRQQAILQYRVANLVLGPGQDGRTIQPEGLKASAMSEHQRALLLELISQWAGIIHESAATSRMAEIRAGLDDTWFAWSGPTTVAPGSNITAYYRIQGPTVVIEYAPQGQGEEAVLHIHTMYRDPTNDYGRKLSAQ